MSRKERPNRQDNQQRAEAITHGGRLPIVSQGSFRSLVLERSEAAHILSHRCEWKGRWRNLTWCVLGWGPAKERVLAAGALALALALPVAEAQGLAVLQPPPGAHWFSLCRAVPSIALRLTQPPSST